MIGLNQIERDSVEEIVINKSKFIAYSFAVSFQEEISKNLEKISQKYPDATHICYAYSIYPSMEKAVDAGEPQGTAGKPILDCIKKANISNVLVVVVRYFGGTKLGAGRLLRTYVQAGVAVLKTAGIE